MNKRGNVRAAVDLHCLGLSPSQTHAQPGGTQPFGGAESETEQQISEDKESGPFAAAAGSIGSEQRLSSAALGSEAASHLASGTLSGPQLSGDPALHSDVPESPLGTPSARRSSRLGPSRFAPPGSVMPSELQETDEPPSAGPTPTCKLCECHMRNFRSCVCGTKRLGFSCRVHHLKNCAEASKNSSCMFDRHHHARLTYICSSLQLGCRPCLFTHAKCSYIHQHCILERRCCMHGSLMHEHSRSDYQVCHIVMPADCSASCVVQVVVVPPYFAHCARLRE